MKTVGYFVIKRDVCGVCGGTGVMQHPMWVQFWSDGGAGLLRDFTAFKAWWHRHGYFADQGPPMEEACGVCDGHGCTEQELPLVEVPNFAEICRRLEAVEEQIGRMPG